MMVRKSKGITDKHIKVLEFLTDYQTKYGRPPSIREIGEKVKISSTCGQCSTRSRTAGLTTRLISA